MPNPAHTPREYPATHGLRAALNASQHATQGQRRTRKALRWIAAAFALALTAWITTTHIAPTASGHIIEAQAAARAGGFY